MSGCIFVFTFCRFIQVTEKAVLKAGRALKGVPLMNIVLSSASSKIKRKAANPVTEIKQV